MDLTTALLLVAGAAVAFSLGLLIGQGRGLSPTVLDDRDRRLLELADSRFREAGARASGELEQRRQAVEHLVAPLKDTLGRVELSLRDLEKARIGAYASLTEQVGFVRESSERLRLETGALGAALRKPQVRGAWGEMHLRRAVELAGMVKHCDFEEQVSAAAGDGDAGRLRPDLVVRLAGGKNVVVDAKVPLAAYLDAMEAEDEGIRGDRMKAHARALRHHLDQLAGKEYWRAFQPTPELVVLFLPGEAFLAPALEHDPSLLDDAMRQRVVIATPMTLLTLLRTVAYAWQQEALTAHAREVFELGQELYRRLGTLGGHVDKLGRSLRRAVGDYNATVGSLERNVLASARRMAALQVTETDLDQPTAVEEVPRPLTAPELLSPDEPAAELRVLRPRFPVVEADRSPEGAACPGADATDGATTDPEGEPLRRAATAGGEAVVAAAQGLPSAPRVSSGPGVAPPLP
jgi:DNA recombination protein RmuC